KREYYEKGEEALPLTTTEESGTEDEKATHPEVKIDIDFE
ncbi:hypothetical protein EZS27_023787, partial [termite gut metagenome]